MKVYLAGPMAPEAKRGAVAEWRKEVISQARGRLEALCPELCGCDHTGIAAEQTVEADLAMLRTADVVLAYLDAPDRPGTAVEVGFATALGIPVVLLVDSWVHDRPWKETGHGCDCLSGNEGYGWPWFMEAIARQFWVEHGDNMLQAGIPAAVAWLADCAAMKNDGPIAMTLEAGDAT